MINKSKEIANFVFYVGVFIATFCGSATLTFVVSNPDYEPTDFWFVVLGIVPTVVGLILIYMGSFMNRKNKRLRTPRNNDH